MKPDLDSLSFVKKAMVEGHGFKRRKLRDTLTRYGIVAGGLSVVGAVVLIVFYLLSVAMPIFQDAELTSLSKVENNHFLKADTLYFSTEEYGEVWLTINSKGSTEFFDVKTGELIKQAQIKLENTSDLIHSIKEVSGRENWLALSLSSGKLLIVEHKYQLTYPNGVRKLIPSLNFPLGEQSISLSANDTDLIDATDSDNLNPQIELFSAYSNDESLAFAAYINPAQVLLKKFTIEEDFMSEELTLEEEGSTRIAMEQPLAGLMLANDGQWLYLMTQEGIIQLYSWEQDNALLTASSSLDSGASITASSPLLGDYSWLVGDSSGRISQWFGYRDKETNNLQLVMVRDFKLGDAPIKNILPEKQRKGFIAIDNNKQLGVFFTTSHRTLLKQDLNENVRAVVINGRSSHLILANENSLETLELHSEHPEISWESLWNKVWYESYSEPGHVWQSSASSNDFESKFSLAPLAYGTLKAAFFAMLFAVPLAISGAIYTAFFMSASLRSVVKPTIEIMEAIPTVILGFLAGLWLAPFIEEFLTGVLLFLLVTPVVILISGYLFHLIPENLRTKIPDGWRPILLMPLLVLIVFSTLSLNGVVENTFFGGNSQIWLRDVLGVNFDQRNALVVGIAMGFAVIPTIFSIAEDAIFSVPKYLVSGSLALGANTWQTLVRVVLPTASPGIFSALMIGMGRAVGETMIVLMATGNTPVMNMNIFEGMRTLAANIAVEMPESEVGSSHFRILFLAALLLFGFTFVANTLAEYVRQRLREKYGSL